MTAQEYLRQIKKIDTLIKNKAYEIKQAELIGVDSTLVRANIKELQLNKAEIINDIQKLKEEEYDVLHKRYVQGKTFYDIADERDITYSNATTIHGRALKNLERIINERKCDCV